jgi:hypothetical protein
MSGRFGRFVDIERDGRNSRARCPAAHDTIPLILEIVLKARAPAEAQPNGDVDEVKREIEQILEGDEAAFLERKRRYGN